jgi:hypothetical protein
MKLLHKSGLTDLLFTSNLFEAVGGLSEDEIKYWTYTANWKKGFEDPSEYSKSTRARFDKMNDEEIETHIKTDFKNWVIRKFVSCGLAGGEETFARQAGVFETKCPPNLQFQLLVDAYSLMSMEVEKLFRGLPFESKNTATQALRDIRNEISGMLNAGEYDDILLAANAKPPQFFRDDGSGQTRKAESDEEKQALADWRKIHADIRDQLSKVTKRVRQRGVDDLIAKKWDEYQSSDIPDKMSEEEFTRGWKQSISGARFEDMPPPVESSDQTIRPQVSSAAVSGSASVELSIVPFNGTWPFNANVNTRQTYGVGMSANAFKKFVEDSGWGPSEKGKTTRSEAVAGYIMGAGTLDSRSPSGFVQGDSVNYDLHVNAPDKLLDGAWEVKQLGSFAGQTMPTRQTVGDDFGDVVPEFTGREEYRTESTRLGQAATEAAESIKRNIVGTVNTLKMMQSKVSIVEPSARSAELQKLALALNALIDGDFSSGDTVQEKSSTGELSAVSGWIKFRDWLVDIQKAWQSATANLDFFVECEPDRRAIETWVRNTLPKRPGVTIELVNSMMGRGGLKLNSTLAADILNADERDLLLKFIPGGAHYTRRNEKFWQLLNLVWKSQTSAVDVKTILCLIEAELPKENNFITTIITGYRPNNDAETVIPKTPKQITQMLASMAGVSLPFEDEMISAPSGDVSRMVGPRGYFTQHRRADKGTDKGFERAQTTPPPLVASADEITEMEKSLRKSLFLDPRTVKQQRQAGVAAQEVVEDDAGPVVGRYVDGMKGFVFIFQNEPDWKANNFVLGNEGASWIVEVFPRAAMIEMAKAGHMGIGGGLTQNKPKIWFNPPGGIEVYKQYARRAKEEADQPATVDSDDNLVARGGPQGDIPWGSGGFDLSAGSKSDWETATTPDSSSTPFKGSTYLKDSQPNRAKIRNWVKDSTGIDISDDEAKRLLRTAINIKLKGGKKPWEYVGRRPDEADADLSSAGSYQFDGDPTKLSKDEYNLWAKEMNKEREAPNKINLAASHNPRGEPLKETQSVFDGGSVGRSMEDWITWATRKK